jgi:hypothetical protein
MAAFWLGAEPCIEKQTTTLVSPAFDAALDRSGNIVLSAKNSKPATGKGGGNGR